LTVKVLLSLNVIYDHKTVKVFSCSLCANAWVSAVDWSYNQLSYFYWFSKKHSRAYIHIAKRRDLIAWCHEHGYSILAIWANTIVKLFIM
jgi:hypothetical protein